MAANVRLSRTTRDFTSVKSFTRRAKECVGFDWYAAFIMGRQRGRRKGQGSIHKALFMNGINKLECLTQENLSSLV